MNRLTIIGNLTKDPELRTTQNGVSVCGFTVAVNRKKTQKDQKPEADYFNVNAWRELGENCAKYLVKGKKVCVVGPVSLRTYQTKDGRNGASLELLASEVEFLSPKSEAQQTEEEKDPESGYTKVPEEQIELPF